MKMAPIIAGLGQHRDTFRSVLIHTGQHYDDAMSTIFFEELGVCSPDYMLGVGSGTHAQQTARVIERLEPVLLDERPDVVLVPGDVNSTMAAAIVAAKLGVTVGHVEAGLRSFDRTMPEELNRIVADSLSDLLFIHSPEARDNLEREGCAPEKIHDVGNTMIDTLAAMLPRIRALGAASRQGLRCGEYLVVTLHRPALVDGPLLLDVARQLAGIAALMPVVFPCHPRTRKRLEGLGVELGDVQLLDPLGYLDFLSLVSDAAGVLTDSGGIQEETTYLGVPCFTLRDNTERPVTCSIGTNTLLGLAPTRIAEVPSLIVEARAQEKGIPDGWDGHAADRIIETLVNS
jgi:UDP-N-acetylglucosamine 2-epimerase (non-hydrolysing)